MRASGCVITAVGPVRSRVALTHHRDHRSGSLDLGSRSPRLCRQLSATGSPVADNSEEVVRRHCIILQRVYMPQLEEEVDCIASPYMRNGEVVNVKYRSLEGKYYRQVKDAEKILYGHDDLTEDWAVIIEGECDKLALEMAGICNAVSVPDGAPPPNSKPSDQKFEYLVTCGQSLEPLKKIVLAVDNDLPGQTLEAELARRLGPERCCRVTWPEDCKDANHVLTRHGSDRLRQCIEEAKPYPIEGVITVADVAEQVMELYREGLEGGVSTGWLKLDQHYTVRPGEMTIVTGIPSHGKSEWLDALVINLATMLGWAIAICSPENLPVQRPHRQAGGKIHRLALS